MSSPEEFARIVEENRVLREQLSQALAGWRDEQRRTRELESRLSAVTMPDAVPGAAKAPVARKPALPKPAPPKPAEWTWAWFVDWFQNK